MPRAFWNGVISFGLVVIPVSMYVASRSKSPVALHYLHKKDLVRPKQVFQCPLDGEYFERDEAVKGYEYAKGQYIVLSDEDFEKVPIKTTHSIDILGFVKEDEIDPVYFDGAHYLEPKELGVKAFAILREALLKTGRVGISKVTFQKREHLSCLRPEDGTMMLHTLHYADEVVAPPQEIGPKQEITPQEVDMATSLIKVMETSFKPEQYKDDYHIALQKVIEAKLKGEEIKAPRPPKAPVIDIMSALKKSLEEAEKREKVPA